MTLTSIQLLDGAAYFTDHETLVLSDLHLGRTQSGPGQAYPEPEYESIRRRVDSLLNTVSPTTIVFNGDTYQHVIPPQEARAAVTALCESLQEEGVDDIVFTVGNHEEDVENLQSFVPNDATVTAQYMADTICYTHGHRTPTTPAELYVIGHVHAQRVVADRRVPCYLYGERAAYDTDILVLPAFSQLVGGVDIETVSSFAGICPLLADSTVPLSEWQVAPHPAHSVPATDQFESFDG